jgi:hypothetical protein
MAKTFRRRHGTRHRKTHRNNQIIPKGFKKGVNKGFKKGFKTVKSTSRKYMPSVKSGLEGVGSKVTKTATKSIPILQKTTRDLFSMIGFKKKH